MHGGEEIGTLLAIGLLTMAASPVFLFLTGWIDVKTNSWPGPFAFLALAIFMVGFVITIVGGATQ